LGETTIAWAKDHGIPTFSYWPALIGRRADYRGFAADCHLLYGEQAGDVLREAGVAPERICVTGSVTFDAALARAGEDHARTVRDRVLRFWEEGDRLVVVGTEALPRPDEELVPVLRALLALEGVHTVLKVHPADSVGQFSALAASLNPGGRRLEVVRECDLMALLGAADLVIGVLSNILVSGAMLGAVTLVCDFGGKRHALDLAAEGLSEGCFDPHHLAATLRRVLFDPVARARLERRSRRARVRFNGACDGRADERVAAALRCRTRGQPGRAATRRGGHASGGIRTDRTGANGVERSEVML